MAEGGVSGGDLGDGCDKTEATEMLNELATDYSDYISLDLSKEKQHFNETIEDLLTKLDEYIGLADMIRSDVNLTLYTTLSSIQAKSKEMEKHFDRIDRLEAFMAVVKKNVSEMESLVEKAESDMGKISSVKKVLNSISLPALFTPRSQLPRSPPQKVEPKFEPVAIFHTDDYFTKHSPDVAELTAINSQDSAVGSAIANQQFDAAHRSENAEDTLPSVTLSESRFVDVDLVTHSTGEDGAAVLGSDAKDNLDEVADAAETIKTTGLDRHSLTGDSAVASANNTDVSASSGSTAVSDSNDASKPSLNNSFDELTSCSSDALNNSVAVIDSNSNNSLPAAGTKCVDSAHD